MPPLGLTLTMTLTLNFKVKHGICYISAKNGPIATKPKPNISIELQASNVTMVFDLGHDLDLEFSRSNMEFAISQSNMVRLPRNEKQTYRLNSRTLAMTLTWIFNVKYGICYFSTKSDPKVKCKDLEDSDRVTSDVGLPSTHLVILHVYIIILHLYIIILHVYIIRAWHPSTSCQLLHHV